MTLYHANINSWDIFIDRKYLSIFKFSMKKFVVTDSCAWVLKYLLKFESCTQIYNQIFKIYWGNFFDVILQDILTIRLFKKILI